MRVLNRRTSISLKLPIENKFKGFSKSYQKRNDLSTDAICKKEYQNRVNSRARSSGRKTVVNGWHENPDDIIQTLEPETGKLLLEKARS